MNQLDYSIQNIGLPNFAANALLRAGIDTARYLLLFPTEKIQQIDGIGTLAYDAIVAKKKELEELRARYGLAESVISEDAFIDALSLTERILYARCDFTLRDILYLTPSEIWHIPVISDLYKICMKRSAGIKDPQDVPQTFRVYETGQPICSLSPKARRAILDHVSTSSNDISDLGLAIHTENLLRIDERFCTITSLLLCDQNDLWTVSGFDQAALSDIVSCFRRFADLHSTYGNAVVVHDRAASVIRTQITERCRENPYAPLSVGDIAINAVATEKQCIIVMEELVKRGLLTKRGDAYYPTIPTYREWVLSCEVLKERERACLLNRLDGFKLQEIADRLGLTRERVRQIVNKGFEKSVRNRRLECGFTTFQEDQYLHFFSTYNVTASWLQRLGGLSDACVYHALHGDGNGSSDVITCLHDPNVPEPIKQKVAAFLDTKVVRFDDETVPCTKAAVIKYVGSKICRNEMSYQHFVAQYNAYLAKHFIPYDELYINEDTVRSTKNNIASMQCFLWKQGEKVRFYDIASYDYTHLLASLRLDTYHNTEVSTELLMQGKEDIMVEYDIRDKYELHNLLKKIIPEGGFDGFSAGRMPYLKFGAFDRTDAILNIITDNAPISRKELLDILCKQYGYNRQITASTYLPPFNSLLCNGVYVVEPVELQDERAKRLLELLQNDFYFIDEIQEIYIREFPDGNRDDITATSLQKLGLIVRSDYVLLHGYTSFMQYLWNCIERDGVIDCRVYSKRFRMCRSYYNVINQLVHAHKIVKTGHRTYMTCNELEKRGVSYADWVDFQNAVANAVPDGEYFTVQSLRNAGFKHKVFDLGFSNYTYAGLLMQDNRLSSCQLVNNVIFAKGVQTRVGVASFVKWLMKDRDAISRKELAHVLRDYDLNDEDIRKALAMNVHNKKLGYNKKINAYVLL